MAIQSNSLENNLCINELIQENKLLFENLYNIKNELSKINSNINYYKSNSEIKKLNMLIESELINVFNENIKQKIYIAELKKAIEVEKSNSLKSRLGNILINGVTSIRLFITLPFRLYKIWKTLDQITPPKILGGKNFQNILNAYTTGGIEAVENLLNSTYITSVMRANAYTALARHTMSIDNKKAAKFARLAWETDPCSYRLKWMAFRVHEANDAITAEALINMLPSDIKLTESEKKHIIRIHQEAKHICSQQAKNKAKNFYNEFNKLYKTISNIKQENYEYEKRIQQLNNKLTSHDEYIQKINNDTSKKIYNLCEAHKKELIDLNNQLIMMKKHKEEANQEVQQSREKQAQLLQELEIQKNEINDFTLQVASVFKNIFTQFESNTTVLSKVTRVIIGSKK